MKIYCETPTEEKLITQLCDVALKAGGLPNMPAIQHILSSIQRPEVEPDKGDIPDGKTG